MRRAVGSDGPVEESLDAFEESGACKLGPEVRS